MIYLLGWRFFFRGFSHGIPQDLIPVAGIFFLLTVCGELVFRLNLRVNDAIGSFALINNPESAPRLLLDVLPSAKLRP